jgi:hypothetical protein
VSKVSQMPSQAASLDQCSSIVRELQEITNLLDNSSKLILNWTALQNRARKRHLALQSLHIEKSRELDECLARLSVTMIDSIPRKVANPLKTAARIVRQSHHLIVATVLSIAEMGIV